MRWYSIYWTIFLVMIIFLINGCVTLGTVGTGSPTSSECYGNCNELHTACIATADNTKNKCITLKLKSREDCMSQYTDEKFKCSTEKSGCQQKCSNN